MTGVCSTTSTASQNINAVRGFVFYTCTLELNPYLGSGHLCKLAIPYKPIADYDPWTSGLWA